MVKKIVSNLIIAIFLITLLSNRGLDQISNVIPSDRVVDWTDSGGGVYIGSGG